VLRRITDRSGEVFVLHLEFQVVDEPDMVFRMADYAVMLTRQYRLPLRQYVVYLGSKPPRMPDRLEAGLNRFQFVMVDLRKTDYRRFVSAPNAAEVLLSILADFGTQPPERVVTAIVQRVEELTEGPLLFQQRMNQLRILAQLRNLQPLIDEVIEHLLKHCKEENDILYLRGQRKGKEEAEASLQQMRQQKKEQQEETVRGMVTKTSLDSETIADIAKVSLAFVERVRKSLAN